MEIYYSTAKLIIRVYQLILPQDCRVNGEIPPAGAKILAANHENATDGFFLPFLFKEKLYYFMQWDLFLIPFLGWLLKKAKQIDVQRGQKNKSLEQAAELLTDGKTVVIFPEGQLNPDHRPVKAGTGAVRLSLMTGAPIIPVGFFVPKQHVHCFEIKKNNSPGKGRWQIGGHCYIQFGSPWQPGSSMDNQCELSAIRELTRELMERIEAQARLAYQQFVREYTDFFTAVPGNVDSCRSGNLKADLPGS